MAVEQHVVITMICEEGHVMGQWIDNMSEKYPGYCGRCDYTYTTDKYPWIIKTQIVNGPIVPIDLESLNESE